MSNNPYAPPGSRVEEASTPPVRTGAAFWVRFYLSPVGRTRRLPYWLFGLLPLFLIGVAADQFIPHTPDGLLYIVALGFLVSWPQTVIIVRRLHDSNLTGWWVVLYWMIPLAFYFLKVSVPGGAGGVLSLTTMVLGVVPGTNGPNRYGSVPG